MGLPTPPQTVNSAVVTHLPTSAARLHGASWPPAPPWMQESPGGQSSSVHNTLVGRPPPHYTPGTYYRTSNPEGSDSLTNETVKQDNSQDASLEAGISSGDIDPNLSAESSNGALTKGVISSSEASFSESGDLNFAVHKALQAVLADSIDPSLSVVASSESNGTLTRPVANSQGQLRNAQLQPSIDADTNERQEALSDTDIVFKALINGDDTTEVIPNGQDSVLRPITEPLPTDDGLVLQPGMLLTIPIIEPATDSVTLAPKMNY